MFSLIKTSIFGMAAIVTLQAGQIQIGAGSNGLTSSYIASSTTSSCSGNTNAYSTGQAGYNGCLAVTQGPNLVQRNYVATLFQNASGATAPAGTTITDVANGNVTFNRIQGNLATGSTTLAADFWGTSSALTSSIVVPVGIYGVDKAWTMLNDYWGGDGQVGNMIVTFRWDDSSNGTGGVNAAYNEVYNLKNGETVRSAVACASSDPAVCKTNNGAMPISTSLDLLVNHGGVTANKVFTDASGNSIGTPALGTRYASQSGITLQLDNQMFAFGTAHLNEFLVSITVTNQITSGYTGATVGTSNSRAALSAVTVNQVVPEPGTVFLSLAGLGAVGYFRRRKA